nr:elongator complex protein 2 [Quercus suber]
MQVHLDYFSAGGNRQPSAADWAPGLFAFGAGKNIALWDPDDTRHRGVSALLAGHTDVVNAVKLYNAAGVQYIISGGADNTVRVWAPGEDGTSYSERYCLSDHKGSINAVSILARSGIYATSSADGVIKVRKFSEAESTVLHTIELKPRYLPLATAITSISDGSIVLAVAGTSSKIQLYVKTAQSSTYELQATLSGHEGWIRGLDFISEHDTEDSDILLASASQDRYIRLWRFTNDSQRRNELTNRDDQVAVMNRSLSNKAHELGDTGSKCKVSFEALLIGHEDWIYTARWAPKSSNGKPVLLSASADNSLALWSADEASGLWVCSARMGEISGQKGSTTATGSAGGFWIGLWSPGAESVASLGRTGSWRVWQHDAEQDMWLQQVGIAGHTQEVRGIAWATDGSYLLTTGSDQTTRLSAEWKRDETTTWHEFSRPQIHGYDLNCIDTVSPTQIISGADEKLLRVFNKPKAIDTLLSKLCGISSTTLDLPDAANIPVLGLSNKAVSMQPDAEHVDSPDAAAVDDRTATDPASAPSRSTLDLSQPPYEDLLARHTLWPEHEKLYGHGYEISCVAASHDGSLIATACKASSIDHAVIRLYDTKEWREVRPALTAHSLTVTDLEFSPDDRYLLSVGRDRQWAMFQRAGATGNVYKNVASNPKGHARMILHCSWAPPELGHVFATAGRDKTVKLWRLGRDSVDCITSIVASAPVTAVAFALTLNPESDRIALVYGTEEGSISLATIGQTDLKVVDRIVLEQGLRPSGAVNALRWRPGLQNGILQLAIGSDDCSVRILTIESLHTLSS